MGNLDFAIVDTHVHHWDPFTTPRPSGLCEFTRTGPLAQGGVAFGGAIARHDARRPDAAGNERQHDHDLRALRAAVRGALRGRRPDARGGVPCVFAGIARMGVPMRVPVVLSGALKLRVDDIDPKRIVVRIRGSKRGRERYVMLSPRRAGLGKRVGPHTLRHSSRHICSRAAPISARCRIAKC